MNKPALNPKFFLMYVANPLASAAFYTQLLGHPPIETSETFVMFALIPGTMLGLWARHTVEPAASGSPGASELAFTAPDVQAVTTTYNAWRERGVVIAQEPTAMDFGYTFVALDLDGHRLRVFARSEQ